MPNLRQLEYLVAIDETRHFRRAAERVNTTQPTLSEQLKALETRLGAQLVERSRSRVVMTPLGREIVRIARRMLSDAEEIRTLAASGGRGGLSGVLRLGLPPTVGPYLLPLIIPQLKAAYPKLKLYVREELPSGLPASLEQGRYDLVLSLLPVQSTELQSEALFREPLYLAVAAGHPLAGRTRLRRSDLKNQDILALSQGHQLHDVVLGLCESYGARLRYDYEGTSLDTLREMVAMGLGVTFLPGLYVNAVAGKDASIRTLKLTDRDVYRTIGLFWRRSSAHAADYAQLAALIRELVAQTFEDIPIISTIGR
jgi:LysR family transcriptional regulator, hydrogen peroxide-inducible genes activator